MKFYLEEKEAVLKELEVSEDGLSSVASSVVMDVARHGGDIGSFVPEEIKDEIIDTIRRSV